MTNLFDGPWICIVIAESWQNMHDKLFLMSVPHKFAISKATYIVPPHTLISKIKYVSAQKMDGHGENDERWLVGPSEGMQKRPTNETQ